MLDVWDAKKWRNQPGVHRAVGNEGCGRAGKDAAVVGDGQRVVIPLR